MKHVVAVLVMLVCAAAVAHPLDPLTAEEHAAAYGAIRAHFATVAEFPDDGLLFPFIALREPEKARVLAGAAVPREATVHVLHWPTNRLWIATVNLTTSSVTRLELAPAGTQPAVAAEEYVVADELVRGYEPWAAAMHVRGVEPDQVYLDVWAPGDLELPPAVVASLPSGPRTRLVRVLSFLRGDEDAPNPYVRPIEGVVVTVDMNQRRVVHMTNTLVRPVTRESGNAATQRTGLKPMHVEQPNGSGFDVEGQLVRWQKWQFRAVLHPREGLVLHDVRYDDRRIAYRLSLSEIYVPYGVPDENWIWRTAFDVGEYNLGQYAQALEPNRDVPEHTHFFDAVFGSDAGETYELPQTIGLYERDNGILWTRTDPSNYARDTRGRRELVATWNAWIGNYIYGFDWIFGMDGSIEVKVVLTGSLLTRGSDGEEETGAPLVAPDVAAPVHQHFFSFRLDLDVDGTANSVAETDIRPISVPGFKNAFGPHETVLAVEGFRDADLLQSRHWEVRGPSGAYAIETRDTAVPYSAPDFEPLLRAAFASHAFWVTRHRDEELYAAGDFPNQGPAGAGLQSFISPPALLGSASDVVVWQTIGLSHVPRPEDYPVMPTETIGFKILPHGFFEKNPALDAQELPARRPRLRPGRP